MPTVLRSGPYRLFFCSADGAEPPHVHVERDQRTAKFWHRARPRREYHLGTMMCDGYGQPGETDTATLAAMDKVAEHNRRAWDRQARQGCRWSIPASPEEIAQARSSSPRIVLTPDTPVPREWLGKLSGRRVLCLASAGGQQAPLLAAAGAEVTSFDLSGEQLALDQQVADREGLSLRLVQGDMRDLSALDDEAYDLIVHVTSNVFVPDVEQVWRECYRVLAAEGELLTGFMNPAFFLFDHDELERGGSPVARYELPYSDETSLSPAELAQWIESGEALEFSHSLDMQIGGQIRAGFVITGLFEDSWGERPVSRWFKPFISTRARKHSPAG